MSLFIESNIGAMVIFKENVIWINVLSFFFVFHIFDQVLILAIWFCRFAETVMRVRVLLMDRLAVPLAHIARIVFGSAGISDVNM